jgi:hypothetical protein
MVETRCIRLHRTSFLKQIHRRHDSLTKKRSAVSPHPAKKLGRNSLISFYVPAFFNRLLVSLPLHAILRSSSGHRFINAAFHAL